MIGDAPDFAQRLRAQLPDRWFPAVAQSLDGILAGLGTTWAAVFGQLMFVQRQTRLTTVSGGFLDMAAADFTGLRVVRRAYESDDQLRSRLLPVLHDKATRAALIARLTLVTGNVPTVCEPGNVTDTGGYGVATVYGGATGVIAAVPLQRADGTIVQRADGTTVIRSVTLVKAFGNCGYGSLQMPFQFFVTVQRPLGQGIPNAIGYGTTAGGYGVGAIEWATLSMELPHVTDQDIYDAILDVLPMGATAWVALTGADISAGPAGLGDFVLGKNRLG